MIAFDFEYYKPNFIEEAVNTFSKLESEGKDPLYYGGGTEIISMARMGNLKMGAVIDIKGISECNILGFQGNQLLVGAAVTLTQIAESNLFPLLGKTSKRVADHTIQGKVTLGGNIAATIIYREAVLPLLLCDAQIIAAGKNGTRIVPISEVFNQELKLPKDEFLVQFIIDKDYVSLPYGHVKKVRHDKIDYPLVTSAALKKDGRIRIAFSGVCSFPFRSLELENELNNTNVKVEERINNAMSCLPDQIMSDLLGSSEYRGFVLKNIMSTMISRLNENN